MDPLNSRDLWIYPGAGRFMSLKLKSEILRYRSWSAPRWLLQPQERVGAPVSETVGNNRKETREPWKTGTSTPVMGRVYSLLQVNKLHLVDVSSISIFWVHPPESDQLWTTWQSSWTHNPKDLRWWWWPFPLSSATIFHSVAFWLPRTSVFAPRHSGTASSCSVCHWPTLSVQGPSLSPGLQNTSLGISSGASLSYFLAFYPYISNSKLGSFASAK